MEDSKDLQVYATMGLFEFFRGNKRNKIARKVKKGKEMGFHTF